MSKCSKKVAKSISLHSIGMQSMARKNATIGKIKKSMNEI
jgi:hypothetical protein